MSTGKIEYLKRELVRRDSLIKELQQYAHTGVAQYNALLMRYTGTVEKYKELQSKCNVLIEAQEKLISEIKELKGAINRL